jgi:hypothetical protein
MKLYWPYSENWGNDVTPTLSYDPLDNEDKNEGFKPVNSSKTKGNNAVSSAGYETILMNDEYVYNNPSLLILPCEDGYTALTCGGGGGGSGSGGGGDIGGGGGTGEIAQKILIGEARLTKQMDGLFAGGSEIYWHSANAVLITSDDTNPTLKPIKKKYSFSRPDIRNKRWKSIYTLFDQNWSDYELARQLHIIEGDGNPKIKKFGIKVAIPKVVEVGFDVENFEVDKDMDSRRTTLFDDYLERKIFLADNNNDDGNGLRNGLKIWHADHLYWTMKVTEVNY